MTTPNENDTKGAPNGDDHDAKFDPRPKWPFWIEISGRFRRNAQRGREYQVAAPSAGIAMFAPYRWEKGTELGLCRQRRPRRRTRAVLLAVVVGGMDYRMWGKATAAVLLRRQGIHCLPEHHRAHAGDAGDPVAGVKKTI